MDKCEAKISTIELWEMWQKIGYETAFQTCFCFVLFLHSVWKSKAFHSKLDVNSNKRANLWFCNIPHEQELQFTVIPELHWLVFSHTYHTSELVQNTSNED